MEPIKRNFTVDSETLHVKIPELYDTENDDASSKAASPQKQLIRASDTKPKRKSCGAGTRA